MHLITPFGSLTQMGCGPMDANGNVRTSDAAEIRALMQSLQNVGGEQQNYHPLPKEYEKSLLGFEGTERLKHKDGARPSWNLGKG